MAGYLETSPTLYADTQVLKKLGRTYSNSAFFPKLYHKTEIEMDPL